MYITIIGSAGHLWQGLMGQLGWLRKPTVVFVNDRIIFLHSSCFTEVGIVGNQK